MQSSYSSQLEWLTGLGLVSATNGEFMMNGSGCWAVIFGLGVEWRESKYDERGIGSSGYDLRLGGVFYLKPIGHIQRGAVGENRTFNDLDPDMRFGLRGGNHQFLCGIHSTEIE